MSKLIKLDFYMKNVTLIFLISKPYKKWFLNGEKKTFAIILKCDYMAY